MGTCWNSTVVKAGIDDTWQTVRDFHALAWAEPVVTSVQAVGEHPGTQVGAQRVLNEVFHETLVEHDDEQKTFAYNIDDGPGPIARDQVTRYQGRVTLFPVTDTGETFVVWTSTYATADDAATADFCNPIYQGLLAALKAHFS